MVITDYLKDDHILINFKALDKNEALKGICDFVARLEGLESEALHQVIWDREKRGSTNLGGGVALPHSQTTLVQKPMLALAVSPQGVKYDSIDAPLVHIIVLLLTPIDGREHLPLLAHFGHLFKSPVTVSEVLKAETEAQIHQIMTRRDH